MTHDTDTPTQEDAPPLHTAVLRWKDDGEGCPFLTTDSTGTPIVVLPLPAPFTMDGDMVGSIALDMAGMEQVGQALIAGIGTMTESVEEQVDTDAHLTNADRVLLAELRPTDEGMRGLPGDVYCLVADNIAQLRSLKSRQSDTDQETRR